MREADSSAIACRSGYELRGGATGPCKKLRGLLMKLHVSMTFG